MDPREYRDARWHALLRAAEDLGVAEERAPELVEQVLARQQRRIRRAEDPDPLVRQALSEAVLGPPERAPRRSRWPVAATAAAAAVALAAAGTVVALSRPEPPPADHLRRRPDALTLRVRRDGGARRCSSDAASRSSSGRSDPARCATGSSRASPQPERRTNAATGSSSTRRCLPTSPASPTTATARSPGSCSTSPTGTDQRRRSPRGSGSIPDEGPAQVLTGERRRRPDLLERTGVLAALHAASSEVALVREHPLTYAVPAVRVVGVDEGLGRCGVPDPSVAGTADVVAFVVRSADRSGCPLRVEVYRDESRRIESVALYPAPS